MEKPSSNPGLVRPVFLEYFYLRKEGVGICPCFPGNCPGNSGESYFGIELAPVPRG